MVLSKKRNFCKGAREVWNSLEIYAAKWSFRILGMREGVDQRGGPLGVWPGPLYIESSI